MEYNAYIFMGLIPIKTKQQLDTMREGGKILAHILDVLKRNSIVGTDVWDLEELFLGMCQKYKVEASCKGYAPNGFPPYPTGLCLSINDESVHCYPIKGTRLNNNDLVTIDTVIKHKDMHVDSAISFGVGYLDKEKYRLLTNTEYILHEALLKIKPGVKIGLLSNTMGNLAKEAGYTVLQDYAGHGIGKKMHENPQIPCYGRRDEGPSLDAGMTLAVESLICEGNPELEHTAFWLTRTADGKNFCQAEHTVAVTAKGCELLTK